MRKRLRFAARRDLRLLAVVLLVIPGWVCWVEYKAGQLADESLRERCFAAQSLEKMGILAWPATDELIEAFMAYDPAREPRGQVRSPYADALLPIGWPAARELATAVEDKRNWNRGWGIKPPADDMAPAAVARGIGEGVPPPFSALREMRVREERETGKLEAALREHASHDRIHVRSWVRHALNGPVQPHFKGWDVVFAPSDSEFEAIIGRLVENMRHDDALVRAWSAHALGGIARCSDRLDWRSARRVLPVVAKALRDDEVMVRYQSSHAVHRTSYHTLYRDDEAPPPVTQPPRTTRRCLPTLSDRAAAGGCCGTGPWRARIGGR